MKKKMLTVFIAIMSFFTLVFAPACTTLPPSGMTKAELSVTYKTVAQQMWSMLGVVNPTQSTLSLSTTASLPSDKHEVTGGAKEQYKTGASVTVGVVNLVGDLFANDNFVKTDKPVIFYVNSITSVTNSEIVKICVLPKVDEVNDVVKLELTMQGEKLGMNYYNFTINYDFEATTNNTSSFRVVVKSNDSISDYIVENGAFYFNNACYTETYEEALDEIIQDFSSACSAGKSLSASFQTEYDTYLRLISRV